MLMLRNFSFPVLDRMDSELSHLEASAAVRESMLS
jgi:hypothetical protein